MTDDFECSYLGGILDMATDAEALVVIAHLDYAHRLGCILRQASQIETIASFGLGYVLGGYGQMFLDDSIDTDLDLLYLFFCGRLRQLEIEFALFLFDMCRYGTTTPEEANHRLIDDVLGGVHGWIFFFVMLVELGYIVHRGMYLFGGFQQKVVSEREQHAGKVDVVVERDG